MKKLFRNAAILTFGMGMALTFTACHNADEVETTKTVTPTTITNSLRGFIFDQDGVALTGATVTINNRTVTVNGNEFGPRAGLADGNYTIVVKKAGYKDVTKTVALAAQVVDGKSYGQDDVESIYMTKDEVKTLTFAIGTGDNSKDAKESITLETSQQDDGTGKIVTNTQDEKNSSLNTAIVVNAQLPEVTSTEYTNLENEGKKQDPTFDLSKFSFQLVNLASLEDAVTTRATVLGEALPGDYTFFTGATLETPIVLDLRVLEGYYVTVSFDIPDDLKNVVKLYRKFDATGWTEVTATTTGNGIANTDFNTSGKISINLNILQSQSFAFGMQIDKVEKPTAFTALETVSRQNTSSDAVKVNELKYMAKEGSVITNNATGAAVDYLRKLVLRSTGLKVVSNPDTEKTYLFSPAYTLAAGGTLFVAGMQSAKSVEYSIVGATTKITTTEYSSFAYHYAVVPVETIVTHEGGNN